MFYGGFSHTVETRSHVLLSLDPVDNSAVSVLG